MSVTVEQLKSAAMVKAVGIVERYPHLVCGADLPNLIRLMQLVYLEGHLDGMKRGHEIDMKAIENFQGAK